jgi:hypothetical protein
MQLSIISVRTIFNETFAGYSFEKKNNFKLENFMKFDFKRNSAVEYLKGTKKQERQKQMKQNQRIKGRKKTRKPREMKEGEQRKRKEMTHGIKITAFC